MRNRKNFSFYSFFTCKKKYEFIEGMLLILPAITVLFIFGYFSFIYAFYLSFLKWNYITDPVFVGIENYVRAIDELVKGISGAPWYEVPFFMGIRNTLIYTIIVVPIQTMLAIVLAAIVSSRIKGSSVFMTSYLLPGFTCSVIIALIFIYFFGQRGFINYLLNQIMPGFGYPDWLYSKNLVIPAMAIVAIWGTSSNLAILFIASMQAVPRDIIEQARLDGAGPIRRFIHVILPMIKPTIVYAIIVGMIGALQMFDLSFVMAGPQGGVEYSGMTVVLDIYRTAFLQLNPGYASAKAVLFFVLMYIPTLIFLRKHGGGLK
ncbi:MAG: sugar ABC transporter permease [Desulfurococcaceae archaeon]